MILERPNDLAQETSDAVLSAVRIAGDRWSSLTDDLPSRRELATEATSALSRALDRPARREAEQRRRMVGGLVLGGLAAALLIGWLVRRWSAQMAAQAEARRLDRQDLARAANEGMGTSIDTRPDVPVPMDMSAPDEDRPLPDATETLDARIDQTMLDRAANGLGVASRR